jgi:hypothetical protein
LPDREEEVAMAKGKSKKSTPKRSKSKPTLKDLEPRKNPAGGFDPQPDPPKSKNKVFLPPLRGF